jgi:molecular chaperone GrpE
MVRDEKEESKVQQAPEEDTEELEKESAPEGETDQSEGDEAPVDQPDIDSLNRSLAELNDKYVRLYADFENFKKVTARNRKELLRYSNEEIMRDLLTVIDHLELALQHSLENTDSTSLSQGVDMTLKELISILQKHGLSHIDALNRPFDPNVHHAMSQIESEDVDENTVIEEFRKGYMYKERVLRAALVGVSTKRAKTNETEELKEEEQ